MKKNKWLNAALPALLIHCSIGTVYCWSTFKEAISAQIGVSTFSLGWAFSLAIFFLGMSAAFCGPLIEKNIHLSSLVSAGCFGVGLVGTGLCIHFLTGPAALIGIYIFYGVIMGIGLGIGYLTPVKTLMLWFKDNKGLATGISIMGFGLAKMIATPIMEFLQNKIGTASMFVILGFFYFACMMAGHFLLHKPEGWVEKNKPFKIDFTIFKDPYFLLIWFIFFLNIHCGLMLISYEKQILTWVGLSAYVAIIPSITAAFNAAGRIGYSTWSDKLSPRSRVYTTILITYFTLGILTCIVPKTIGFITVIFLIAVNAGYGGGFSTLPSILSDRFGMTDISKIHGVALSAWAVAGITGNNTSALILKAGGNYKTVMIFALIFYSIETILYIRLTIKEN